MVRQSLDCSCCRQIAEVVKPFAPARPGTHQPQPFPVAKPARIESQDAPDFSPSISLSQAAGLPMVRVSANDYAPNVNQCGASSAVDIAAAASALLPEDDMRLRGAQGLLDFEWILHVTMPLESAERLYIERQVTLARAILLAIALVDLVETAGEPARRSAVLFLTVYLLLAISAVLVERFLPETKFHIPLPLDFAALAIFLFLTPSVSAFWFLFLFSVFALATREHSHMMFILVGAATGGIIVRVAAADAFGWHSVMHWVAVGAGTIVSGLGMAFLGAREREHLAQQQFLAAADVLHALRCAVNAEYVDLRPQ